MTDFQILLAVVLGILLVIELVRLANSGKAVPPGDEDTVLEALDRAMERVKDGATVNLFIGRSGASVTIAPKREENEE